MNTFITTSRLAALFGVILASGCATRPDPAEVAFSVASTKPGTEYHLTGNVNLDGKTTTVDQQTPYRFAGKGVEANAKLVSTDTDCQLQATYASGTDHDLVSQATGPVGCEIVLKMEVKDKTSSTQINVKPLPVPRPAPVPAAEPAPAAAPNAQPAIDKP